LEEWSEAGNNCTGHNDINIAANRYAGIIEPVLVMFFFIGGGVLLIFQYILLYTTLRFCKRDISRIGESENNKRRK